MLEVFHLPMRSKLWMSLPASCLTLQVYPDESYRYKIILISFFCLSSGLVLDDKSGGKLKWLLLTLNLN